MPAINAMKFKGASAVALIGLAVLAAGCETKPKVPPGARPVVTVEPPTKSEAWKKVATVEDEERLARLNAAFAAYGVGRGLYTGDTTIGLKGRIVFEAPGLTALLTAHRALEEAVLSKQQNRAKPDVARKWVELVYEGFYHDPLKSDLEAFLASSQRKVSGAVVLETRGGRVDAVAVDSPHLLTSSGAVYAQSADWGVEEAEGFIKLFGMSSTLWAQVNAMP